MDEHKHKQWKSLDSSVNKKRPWLKSITLVGRNIFNTLGCAVQAWKCALSLYCLRHRGTEHPDWRKGSWCWHTFGDTDTQRSKAYSHIPQITQTPPTLFQYDLQCSLWALNHHYHCTFSSPAGTQTSAVPLEWRRLESLCPEMAEKKWTDAWSCAFTFVHKVWLCESHINTFGLHFAT